MQTHLAIIQEMGGTYDASLTCMTMEPLGRRHCGVAFPQKCHDSHGGWETSELMDDSIGARDNTEPSFPAALRMNSVFVIVKFEAIQKKLL